MTPDLLRHAKEEKGRRAAKKSFKAFMHAHPPKPDYVWGRHTHAIAEELQKATEAVERGECYYVIINCPPRHGKTDLCSRSYPVWHLIRNPNHEVMMTSYGATLCQDNSRDAKKKFARIGPSYGLTFQKDQNRVDAWGMADLDGNDLDGVARAVGIDGGATGKGADCFPAGTMISTQGGEKDIAHLVQSGYNEMVWSFNHTTGRPELCRVIAARRVRSRKIIRLDLEDGRNVRCTNDHRIWDGDDYREAATAAGSSCLLLVRDQVHAPEIRGEQAKEAREQGCLLRDRVQQDTSCHKEQEEVCLLWRACSEEDKEVLRGMYRQEVGPISDAYKHQLRILHERIQAKISPQPLLFDGLQERDAEQAHEHQSLQVTEDLQQAAQGRGCHLCEGFKRLHDLLFRENALHASRGRGFAQQPAREPANDVQVMPHETPRVEGNSIQRVVEDSRGEEWVYDIQVEGNNNFFANGILVHNCLIIDDYLKGRASAESKTIRDRTMSGLEDDFLTRLAPVHAVIILATRWNEDDPDGRLKKLEERDPNFPKFKRLIFPALGDERTDYEGEWLFPERFNEAWYLLQKSKGRYSWESLFQQKPTASKGNQIRVHDYQIIEPDEIPPIRYYRGWDPASTDAERNSNDPDYTVGIKAGIDDDGWLIISDCVSGQWDAPERDTIIESTMKRDGPAVRQQFEGVGAYIDTVRRLQKSLAGKCIIEEVRPKGDKTVRAAILEAFFESGKVKFVRGHWLDALVDQLSAFPNAPHDDMVDALVYAVFKLIDQDPEEFVC